MGTTTTERSTNQVSVSLRITDAKGIGRRYTCKPILPPIASALKSYRLTRYDEAGTVPEKVYLVQLHESGSCTCDCDGSKHFNHCKHRSALIAAGLLDSGPWMQLAERRSCLQDLIDDVNNQQMGIESQRDQLNAKAAELADEAARLNAERVHQDARAAQLDRREDELEALRMGVIPVPAAAQVTAEPQWRVAQEVDYKGGKCIIVKLSAQTATVRFKETGIERRAKLSSLSPL